MTDKTLKVWIEISRSHLKHNISEIRKQLKPGVLLWAVVKSNAYGHGLVDFSRISEELGVDGFCVDSVIEGVKLRKNGITKPILALGPTLDDFFDDAFEYDITVSIASFDAINAYVKNTRENRTPSFHLKIDTGMYRQGFSLGQVPDLLKELIHHGIRPNGVYTHYATAKNPKDIHHTEAQRDQFEKAIKLFDEAGFANLMRHAAGTSSVLHDTKSQFDMVRVGSGLYGFFPSPEIEEVSGDVRFSPVLSFYSVITEIKNIQGGACVGYNRTVCVERDTTAAIIPVGYWHGVSRSLSNSGSVLVRGKRASMIGLISMDITTVDVSNCDARVGDTIVIIGKDGAEQITAWDIARAANTIPQEFLTRINPRIQRVVVA